MQSMATVMSMQARREAFCPAPRRAPPAPQPGDALFASGLDDLLAAIVAARADVMTQMHFARRGLDRKRRVGEKVMGAMHTALRRRLFVLLDCHKKNSFKFTSPERPGHRLRV